MLCFSLLLPFSLISTPPPERVPIKTHLSAFGKEKVIAAIQYELDRGGQVFYVLPRIKGNALIHIFLFVALVTFLAVMSFSGWLSNCAVFFCGKFCIAGLLLL